MRTLKLRFLLADVYGAPSGLYIYIYICMCVDIEFVVGVAEWKLLVDSKCTQRVLFFQSELILHRKT